MLAARPGSSQDQEAFTREQISCLEHEGIFQSPPPGAGNARKRTVSAAYSSSSSSSSSASSAPVATVIIRGVQPSTVLKFNLPLDEESVENPDDLLAFARGHISQLHAPYLADADPQAALATLGLTTEFQNAILDPRFAHILGTRDLFYWVKDTMHSRYATLLAKQELFKNNANRLIQQNPLRYRGGSRQHPRHRHRHSREQNPLRNPATSKQHPERQDQNVSLTINLPLDHFRVSAAWVAIGIEGAILPNHTILYKERSVFETPGLPYLIDSDGNVHLEYLNFRFWGTEDLWYSSDWKEDVWTCRHRATVPGKFHHLYDAGLVTGNICIELKINRMAKDDVQRAITREFLLKHENGRPAIQWVFLDQATIKKLSNALAGKIHIDVFLPVNPR
ncbi:hypothetical protein N7492_009550 [Penicillium capsulatum]|uniref:Uncharacterized protein n=1 Tax=Penicillium capsulatum TaxID=69766 RepID=A0A9W9LI69_9EURO|nr:hypothetical protein N7492_009550 [Penicillium capsulatum]KAJ6106939.1 hypothetical protein N7512_010456 [Penicillium capsulatum]